MKKCAALVVGLSLAWSAAGCCCSHLGGGGNYCGYGPAAAPACPPGGPCGIVPGAAAPGLYQGASLITTETVTAAAPISASPITYTVQQPAVVVPTRTVMVESLPTY